MEACKISGKAANITPGAGHSPGVLRFGRHAGPGLSGAHSAFRLGMPHLDGTGLALNWLMRECCHRHWWAIAETIGTTPSGLRDIAGDRVMASVVSAKLQGSGTAFAEDDIATLGLVCAPSAANGWRSETIFRSESGAAMTVELLTAFAKRSGKSNTGLAAGDMPEALRPPRADPAGRRARILRARGRAERAAAEELEEPPHMSFPIVGRAQFNGVGLTYFANFNDFFDHAEAAAMPPALDGMPSIDREIHYFANIDAGDTLEIHTRISAAGIHPVPVVECISHARRRSDGAVIAAARTRRHAA